MNSRVLAVGGQPGPGTELRGSAVPPNSTPSPGPRLPVAGDVVRVGRAASVQFAATPFAFRVARVEPAATCDGWVWLDGYELDVFGDAIVQRSILVRLAGLG